MLEGITWNARFSGGSSVAWKPLEMPKFKRTERTYKGLTFAEMEAGVLYRPLIDTYPAVEFCFKLNEEKVVGVQVSRENKGHRKVEASAWEKMVNNYLQIEEQLRQGAVKVEYWYVPLPKIADTAKVTLPTKKSKDMVGFPRKR